MLMNSNVNQKKKAINYIIASELRLEVKIVYLSVQIVELHHIMINNSQPAWTTTRQFKTAVISFDAPTKKKVKMQNDKITR